MKLSSRTAIVFAVATTTALSVVIGGVVTGSANAAAPNISAATPAGGYVALPPDRILDTRTSLGGKEPAGHGVVSLTVAGVGDLPSTVAAVVLNVTVTEAAASGYVTVYPSGTARPTASNLNFPGGRTVANLVIAQVGADGRVDLYNGSAQKAELIADVSGYYTDGPSTDAGTFQPLAPKRILDTRTSLGGARPAGGHSVTLKVAGVGGVPSTGVGAVVLNVTATEATAGGYVSADPDDGGFHAPVSNLNFTAGSTVADLVVVPVAANGKILLLNGSSKPVQLVADVAGYTLPGQAQVPVALNPVSPVRLLDTRSDSYGIAEPSGHQVVSLPVSGQFSIPPTGVSAVVLTVTVTGAQDNGYITAYAGDGSRPTASNVNFSKGQTVANLVIAPVGADGTVNLYNGSAGKVEVIADVDGYYSSLVNPWTATTPADPAGDDSEGMTSVSCPAVGSCVAVGMWLTRPAFIVGPLIETLDSGTWTQQVLPTSPATHTERKLQSISCAAVTDCTAVGFDSSDATGAVSPVVETLTGGAWTAQNLPVPDDGDGLPDNAQLNGVSCTSATECIAVGTYTSSAAGAEMLIETLAGGTWTADLPTLPTGDTGDLEAVSCTSDTVCVAVGGVSSGPGSGEAAVAALDAGAWTLTDLDTTQGQIAQDLTGVSCPAVGSCVAVSPFGAAETLAADSWTGSTIPFGMNSISCPAAASDCTAVGAYTADRSGDLAPIVATLSSDVWTPFGLPRPTGSGQLLGVSCTGVSDCVAVGAAVEYTASAVSVVPLIESESAA